MVTLIAPRKVVATATASATLARGAHTPVDATSGAKTMTLPTNAPAGVEVSVEKVDASANAVTISGTLRGVSSSITLTTQYEARTFLSDGTGSWRPTSDHRTATALTQTIANQAEAKGLGQRARGMVCFTYDDGYDSWPTLKALADARGQRNTFFVTSNHIGVNLTNADLTAYVAAGHEIGAHSKTHAHIPAATIANRAIEYDDPKTVIEAVLGAGTVRSWAYPFGDRNATTDQELYGRYPQIFGTGYAQPCVIPLEDRYGRFLYGRQQWLQNTHSTVLDLINLAYRNPVVVVFYCHDPGNTSGSFATDPTIAQITEAYDLAKSLGVPAVTVGEALPSGNVVRNPGFEDGLTAWQMPLGIPTGLTVESLTDVPDSSLALPGNKSLHLGAAAPIGANFIIEQTIPVKPGTSWNWGARWRGTLQAGNLQFDFQRLDYSGTQIATTSSALIGGTPTYPATAAWGRPTRAVVLEANCVAVNIKMSVGTGFQGDVYLDHVDMRPTQHGLFA